MKVRESVASPEVKPSAPSAAVIIIVGAVKSPVVKFQVVVSEIPAYELLETSSNAVADICI